MLRTASLRVLGPADLPAVTEILDRDPVANVFVASRVERRRPRPLRLGGELWGYFVDGRLDALCYAGANLVPVQAGPDASGRSPSGPAGRAAAAPRSWAPGRRSRRCGTLLEPAWGPARDVRPNQPLMVDRDAPTCAATPAYAGCGRTSSTSSCRPASRCSPRRSASRRSSGDGGAPYRARVAELIAPGGRSRGSRTAGWSSRPRSGRRRGRPARSRASGCAASCGGGACRHGGMAAVVSEALRDDRPGGQPLRQRLQRGCPRDLPPRRVRGLRHVHVRPLLTPVSRSFAAYRGDTPGASRKNAANDLRGRGVPGRRPGPGLGPCRGGGVSGMWAWRGAGGAPSCIVYSTGRTNRQCRESAPCRTSAVPAAASRSPRCSPPPPSRSPGCGSDDADASSSGKPVTLRLGYFPNLTHATAIVGVEEGTSPRRWARTSSKTQTFNAGPEATQALLSGALDATYIGPDPATNAYAKSGGEAVRVISGATSGGAALVVKPEITSVADLKGKKIATPQLGNTQDIALRSWLKEQGPGDHPGGWRRRVDRAAGEQPDRRHVRDRGHRRCLGARALG